MSYRWYLFLDDERFPVEDGWVICRSSQEAVAQVTAYGFPTKIAFDHDLGGNDTSILFINWLLDQILDMKLTIPKDFEYSIHSQNPVGVANIKHYMDNIIRNFGRKENDS
jgi:hypothetical protein